MKRFMLLLGFLLMSSVYANPLLKLLPPPYNELKELLPFDPHSFFCNGPQLRDLIKKNDIKVVVEIGSWLGASTRHIAQCLPPKGKVYAVDHWLGSVEHQEGEPAWHHALPYLYDQFLSNVIISGLWFKIIPVRMSSLDAAQTFDFFPDLIYLDASHDTESVYADLQAWYPFVKGHGILCGDDWVWSSVVAAVERFARENHLQIIAEGNFWWLKE